MPKFYSGVKPIRKPEWLKIRLHNSADFADVDRIVKEHSLYTICSSGMCPNKSECWSRRVATFMILGDVCTRNCQFCATKSGRPLEVDTSECESVAQSVKLMNLRHVVITSVTRDDLPDGGAHHWVRTIEATRQQNPDATIELLIPDLDAREELLQLIVEAKADIVGHNIETVRALTPKLRSRAEYDRSLEVLRILSERGAVTKSGLMVGLGESEQEVVQTLKDLRSVGVKFITIGQYLRPTLEHYPVAEYVTPQKFEWYREQAIQMGFAHCASAPLVRSSYLADQALEAL